MDDLAAEYRDAIVAFLASPDEEARARAYGLGRAAMSRGLGVLDLSRLHLLAMTERPEVADSGARSWAFFQETLAPFEMALRRFREANTSLKRVADELEERVATRTAELAQADRLMREQRNRLSSVIRSMSDGVFLADASGALFLVNPAAERMVGVGSIEGDLSTWSERFGLFLTDERTPMPTLRIPLVRALAGEHVYDEEFFVRNAHIPDGVHLSASASPLRDEAGRTLGGMVVVRDVTPRRRAEEAARAAEDRLARAQKLDAVGQLAGGVAHDFNNLLAVIASYASLLSEDLANDPARLADLREIQKATHSAASLTRQLLAFSRQQVLQPRSLDLNEIVADVASMLRRTIGEHIVLATSLDAGLGPVRADRGQIEQVLVNLALNARDAMPAGGRLMIETRNLTVEAGDPHALAPGQHVLLCVTDAGCGMDSATKARIFEPFFTTKPMGRGTGLGLATVYGIVRQSGGSIQVYSEPGSGTSFKIYFPQAEAVRARTPVAAPRSAARGSETILLVEDEESVRAVATKILERSGYAVLVATDPAEARAICARPEPIHLLLSDVVMPGMSGPDLAAELAALRPSMRVLFMSGYSAAGIGHQGRLPPNAAFLEKPFTAESLRQQVRAVIAEGDKA